MAAIYVSSANVAHDFEALAPDPAVDGDAPRLGPGVTANQVALTSLAGSVVVGALLSRFADHPTLFTLTPLWQCA